MERDGHGVTSCPSWRYWAIVTAFGLLLGGAAFWGATKNILGLFHDDGIYAVVAKSISEGSGYRIISLPGTPPQTKYPFLYSYLLSWIWAFDREFPNNILALKAFNMVVLVALFYVGVVFYRRNFKDGRAGAVAFALLLCTNPVIFTLTDYVLSDLLLVLFALTSLTLSNLTPSSSNRNWLVLAFSIGLACITRSAAIPLVVAGVAHTAFRSGIRPALCFIGAVAVVIAPWLLWIFLVSERPASSLFGYYSTYDSFSAGSGWTLDHQWMVIAGNARHLLASFELIVLLPLLPAIAPAIYFFTAMGGYRLCRGTQIFLWSFLLSTLALLLIWPFHPNRYTAPLIGVFLFFLFRGIRDSQCWLGGLSFGPVLRQIFRGVVTLPIVLLLLLNGIWLSSYLFLRDEQTTRGLYGSRLPYGWSGFAESFAWIREYTAPDSILGTGYDPMYFLYTGRQAIRPALHRPVSYFYPYHGAMPDVGTAAEVHPQMVKLGVRYLIIDPMDGYAEGAAMLRLFDDILRAYGSEANLVFTSSDGKHFIYELNPKTAR
jgi:hypothetical protein